ncbi:hypothetical protein GCM10022381_16350 [Leifsonia kafniensis]|uniref:Rhamnan synthesis protein F n=1 Tax=Leifsonia kafniensis TaxID=475957 RepID=A0ABP7KFN4_9MICO
MAERVLRAVMPSVRIERGSKKLPETDRVALVASFSDDNAVSRSLAILVRELELNSYTVIVVRASADTRPLVWPSDIPSEPIVVRKANVGYDFGSWAVGLKLFPGVRRKKYVIFANDSLVGPFASLTPLIHSFENSSTDVWAATNTRQIRPHLQSFFIGYRNGILADRALRQFWSNLNVETDKQLIIERYEMGLSQLLLAEGLTTSACFESERVVSQTENPTVEGWRNLLKLGFPFVKRELVTNSAVVSDGSDVPAVVHEHFGTDPRGWL